MNRKYVVYLTKSSEVSSLLFAGLLRELEGKPNLEVSCGHTDDGEDCIPAMYANKGYFCCIASYDNDKPEYELIFA